LQFAYFNGIEWSVSDFPMENSCGMAIAGLTARNAFAKTR
jgi:hypothetical protein